jgi:TRAP-type uncharacterized transport system substrate-binding protein
MRISEIAPSRLAAGLLALVLLTTGIVWLVARHFAPPPPKVVVMSTGAEDGAYHAFALRYRDILAQHGVTLELKPSTGALQNLERLREREDGVSLALVQGGLANAENTPGVVTLGSLFYEPLWVFYRADSSVTTTETLRGKRIAIGVPGSGTHAVAMQQAAAFGLKGPPTKLLEIGGLAAAAALQRGEIDAAFFISAPDAPAIQQLARTDGVRMLVNRRADAQVRRHPFLYKRILPEGTLDLVRNIPPQETPLLSVTANLLAAEEIHPAIVDLMLEAAKRVHGPAGLFNNAEEFPSPMDLSLPLSSDAERYYKQGPPALRRYLPFWAAVWIERTVFFLVPLLAILVPILHYLPVVWRWRTRRNVYRWYGELKLIERDARRREGDPAKQLARLDAIEDTLDRTWVPLGIANELFMLRQHVGMVRDVVNGKTPRAPTSPAGAAVEPNPL